MKPEQSYPLIENLLRDVMVHLVRQVEWGPKRDALEAKVSELRSKAMWERGMCDNHDTANLLHWKADLYQLAAEVRFERAEDHFVEDMKRRVRAHVVSRFTPRTEPAYDDFDFTQDRSSPIAEAVNVVIEGYPALKQRYVKWAVEQKLHDAAVEKRKTASLHWHQLTPEDRKEARMEKIDAWRAGQDWLRRVHVQATAAQGGPALSM